jgi:hypothetical protein
MNYTDWYNPGERPGSWKSVNKLQVSQLQYREQLLSTWIRLVTEDVKTSKGIVKTGVNYTRTM